MAKLSPASLQPAAIYTFCINAYNMFLQKSKQWFTIIVIGIIIDQILSVDGA